METIIDWPIHSYCANSDPTYEAWKLDEATAFLTFELIIPILPMRHGNNTELNESMSLH